ncbi:MAG: hypothetical protein AAF441_10560 [Pseudomonadota bacterium]
MTDRPEDPQASVERLRVLLPVTFVSFFGAFAALFFVSPGFQSVVGQAFGDLNEAVLAMVAWCRSI